MFQRGVFSWHLINGKLEKRHKQGSVDTGWCFYVVCFADGPTCYDSLLLIFQIGFNEPTNLCVAMHERLLSVHVCSKMFEYKNPSTASKLTSYSRWFLIREWHRHSPSGTSVSVWSRAFYGGVKAYPRNLGRILGSTATYKCRFLDISNQVLLEVLRMVVINPHALGFSMVFPASNLWVFSINKLFSVRASLLTKNQAQRGQRVIA